MDYLMPSETCPSQSATKDDLQELSLEMQLEIDTLRTELLVKLGGIVVACAAILGTLIAIFSRMH